MVLIAGLVIQAETASANQAGVQISNAGSGKCLTVVDGSRAVEAPVVQMPCGDRPGQHWIFGGPSKEFLHVQNVDTGLCLTPTGFANGDPVVQRRCDDFARTYWSRTELSGSPARIILKSADQPVCLDLENGDASDGVPLQVWECDPSTDNQKWVRTTAPEANFSISLRDGTGSLLARGSTTTVVEFTPASGFNGSAQLSVTGLPAGVTASFSNTTVDNAKNISILTLRAADAVAAGDDAFLVWASADTAAGPVADVVRYQLNFAPTSADFRLLGAQGGTVADRGSISTDVGLFRSDGRDELLPIFVTDLPKGVTASFDQAHLSLASPTARLTLTSDGTANVGTYTVQIWAFSTNTGESQSIPYKLTLAPPVSLSPTSGSISDGWLTTTVTLAPQTSVTGELALTATGMPEGVSASFSPAKLSSASPTAELTFFAPTPAALTPGSYPVTVTATPTQGPAISVTFTMIVDPLVEPSPPPTTE